MSAWINKAAMDDWLSWGLELDSLLEARFGKNHHEVYADWIDGMSAHAIALDEDDVYNLHDAKISS